MNEEAYRDRSGTDLWIGSDRIWHPELWMRSANVWDMTHRLGMADPQAWQAQLSHQHWFDHSTSRHAIQPQPQPGLDLATVPSHDSDTQTDRGRFSNGRVVLFLQLQTFTQGFTTSNIRCCNGRRLLPMAAVTQASTLRRLCHNQCWRNFEAQT
jgi:hypothetical protein